MKLGIAQINVTVGDLLGNTQKIINYINKAKEEKLDIVVFPELALCGYPPKDLLFRKDFILALKKSIKAISEASWGIYTILGSVEVDGRLKLSHLDLSRQCDSSGYKIYNSALVLYNNSIVFSQRKTYLPTYDVFNEERYFCAADYTKIFKIKDYKLGITVCEDIWVNNGLIKNLVQKGVNLIVNISASPFYVGKYKIRQKLLTNLAKIHKIPIIYCNLVGGLDELVFDGGSMGYDGNGKLIFEAKRFAEDFIVCDLANPYPIKYPKQKWDNEIEEIYCALILGLKDYVQKNNFKKVVIGLSGGIDSAVVAALAVKALGKENVELVIMPGPYSSAASVTDAQRVAKNLSIKPHVISINKLYEAYLKTLAPKFKNLPFDSTEENIQARIRGNLLMALSNKFGWLVLITGNKSEFATGYTTLYGDMAGGFGVIADLYKTKVYELAHYINKTSKCEIIPKSIFKKPPSAELRPGQTDQSDLPPYEILDKIIYLYIEKNKTKEEIIAMGFTKKVVCETISRIYRNEYKRKQAPVGIKLTPKAFVSGRLMTITNRFFFVS
ncbi:MAG: NAD+ synthase [candidate division WOR-3 bacterium]|nr:NAD+ synthase [candidate division WOR-3 bacterium]